MQIISPPGHPPPRHPFDISAAAETNLRSVCVLYIHIAREGLVSISLEERARLRVSRRGIRSSIDLCAGVGEGNLLGARIFGKEAEALWKLSVARI